MLAVAAAVSLLTAVAAVGPTSSPDPISGPGEGVPYVGQGRLLCGGAALAMVLRFWGETGVYAADFEPLVREEEGGIRTTDLADAAEGRGYAALVPRSGSVDVFEALDDGIPSILLLGAREPLLHYVVLVQADRHDVWIHDPAIGPMRRMSREELEREWAASGRWALIAVPETTEPGARHGPGQSAVTASSVETSALADRAISSLDEGRFDEAERLARRLVASGGDSERAPDENRIGRRLLATSYYLQGEDDRALTEWNTLGEPRVDLVTVHGSETSRHEALLARTGIAPGDLLTPTSLGLARRRLAEEPSLEASRIEYRPNADGTVQVHAHVVDRPVVPTVPGLGVQVLRGLVNDEARLEAGPLIGSADRWRLEGGWSPEHSSVGGRVRTEAAPLPGVVTVSFDWTRERYRTAGAAPSLPAALESRVRGAVGLHEWVGVHTLLGGSLGLERWNSGAHVASASAEWRRKGEVLRASLHVDGWAGTGLTYGRVRGDVAVRLAPGAHQAWNWTIGAATTSSSAPRMIWPRAGTGRLRSALLRGYPLADGGSLTGLGFGPHLVHTSLGYRRWSRLGPIRVGGGVFSDAAYLPGAGVAGGNRTLGDVGAEIFVGPGDSEAALSLARGGEGWVLSARVSEAW